MSVAYQSPSTVVGCSTLAEGDAPSRLSSFPVHRSVNTFRIYHGEGRRARHLVHELDACRIGHDEWEQMDRMRRKRLVRAGWKPGTGDQFLGLSRLETGWSPPSSPSAMRSGHFANGAASPRRPWRSEWARASRASPSSRMGLRAPPSTSTSERSSPCTLQPRGTSEGSPGGGPGERRLPRDERLGEPAPARDAGHGHRLCGGRAVPRSSHGNGRPFPPLPTPPRIILRAPQRGHRSLLLSPRRSPAAGDHLASHVRIRCPGSGKTG